MRILAFGHLPKIYGGRQSSGASFVIYHLCKSLSELDDIELKLCATDVYEEIKHLFGIDCIGWTRSSLIKYCVKKPLKSICLFIKCVSISILYNLPIVSFYCKTLHLQRSIDDFKPDVIHFHSIDSYGYIKVIFPNKAKIVYTIHSLNGINKDEPLRDMCYKLEKRSTVYPSISALVFVASRLRDNWIEAYGQPIMKSYVICNAYDNSVFNFTYHLKKERGTVRIATIAAVTKLKGQERVLDAIGDLPDKQHFEYYCAGAYEEEDKNRLLNKAYQSDVKFHLMGVLEPKEVATLLRRMDFMILPSSYEGFGLVLLESLACGTPVIVPRHLPIVQEPGLLSSLNSILIEDESVESIKQVLPSLLDLEFNNDNISASVRNCAWDQIAFQYFQMFKEL